MQAEEIRTQNIRSLVEQYGYPKLVAMIDRSQSQISQWANNSLNSRTKKPSYISGQSCRMIEKALNLPIGWMDTNHREEKLAEQFPDGESPYIGEKSVPWYPRPEWTEVGNWGEPEKWFCCNVEHSNDTFCVTARDMSMYSPNNVDATIIKGDIAFVDPNAKWQDGDFVFATSSHYKLASIKQYVIQGPEDYLFTPNPSWQQQWIKIDDTIKIYGKVVSIFRRMK